MITIKLKKEFKSNSEAWRYLMTFITAGDEEEFESIGEEEEESVSYYDNDIKELGLI